MRFAKKVFLIVISFLLLSFVNHFVFAAKTPQEIQDEITKYEQELGRLSQQAKTLSSQMAQFDAQIKLTSLKITQTEEKILLLGGRIDQLEGSLTALTKAFSSRVVETYKVAKSGSGFFFLISSEDLNQAIARFHYLQKIQEADRVLLEKLQKAQTLYKGEKEDQEDLQNQLETQKKNLNNQKAAKASLLTVTKGDEKKYQQLLSQAKAQLAALRRFVVSQGGASILSNQTKCDSWGCYYNQRDSIWGNMGLGGSSYSVAEYGCLVSSVSMIASHIGKNIKPSDIAANPDAFQLGTGLLKWLFSANNVNVSISSAPKSELDQRLNSGPVIAGLYGGPDHFIVILRKEGDNYIMHDPFIENGSSRPLGDKYNVSDITSLRLVQFN